VSGAWEIAEADPWRIETTPAASPLLAKAADLRFRVLYAPFGVQRDGWVDDPEEPGFRHLLALAGERLVGYGRLIVALDGATAQIRQVCVEPAWQRRGIGSALVRACVDQARAEGVALVWLNARTTALALYERAGFAATGHEFISPATGIPHRRMELPLGQAHAGAPARLVLP
jgi:ribosomal protein S18 acetylase RimI-like enzyme